MTKLTEHYEENVSALRRILDSDRNFDILEKHLLIAGHAASLFFLLSIASSQSQLLAGTMYHDIFYYIPFRKALSPGKYLSIFWRRNSCLKKLLSVS